MNVKFTVKTGDKQKIYFKHCDSYEDVRRVTILMYRKYGKENVEKKIIPKY